MSWLFSQALVAEYSAENCLDGAPSVPLSVMPTPHKFWYRGRTMDALSLSQFGLTCAVLTADRGEELLTWFLAGFHARTSAHQEKERDLTANALDSGWKWRESFVKFDRASRSWKTRQCSLLGGWDEFSETWPKWGSMRDGECLELKVLEPLTQERESGLLPTPRASVGTHGICWKRAKDGNHRSQIEDYLGCLSLKNGGQVVSGRTVNADFQDWLMVWPIQWTDLQPLAMAKYQQWQQLHSRFFQSDMESP